MVLFIGYQLLVSCTAREGINTMRIWRKHLQFLGLNMDLNYCPLPSPNFGLLHNRVLLVHRMQIIIRSFTSLFSETGKNCALFDAYPRLIIARL